MPVRRTSPRRSATRPSVPFDRLPAPREDDVDDDEPARPLTAVAPWLAALALVLAAGAIGFVLVRGGGDGDLTACRRAAWNAVPAANALPEGWSLESTDLNANGLTVSLTGATSDPTTDTPPVVYASVTCYGEGSAAALDASRAAAKAAKATVEDRPGGSDAFDILNATTGSTTTVFRVGSLVAQIADSGQASRAELDGIAEAMAAAMGERTAAGTSPNGPDAGASGSEEPGASADVGEASAPPFAPELEAALPTAVPNTTTGASAGATIPLTVDSASAADIFSQASDPASRALAARIRSLGKSLDDLEYAEAFDETGTLDVAIRGFRLPGMDGATLRDAITETWLAATAAGVKTDEVTIAGKKVTRIDYGDDTGLTYVYLTGDVVIDVETSTPEVAESVFAAIK